MKYCVNYHKDFRHLDKIDEIIIKFENQTQKQLIDFLETMRAEVRVIVKLEENSLNIDKATEIFANAKVIHSNFSVALSGPDAAFTDRLKEKEIPFFYSTFVDKWDVLMSFLSVGVSDVYIVNELGFDLKDVSKVCKEYNAQIRVFPNVAQLSSRVGKMNKLKSFFIRPDDIEHYEPYVDVCEFFGPIDRQSVLYEIYTDKKWIGDLRELIIGLKEPLKSKYLMPCFGEERLNCRKKCYQNKCIICDKVLTIAKQLEKASLEIKIEEKENEYQINEASNENKTG